MRAHGIVPESRTAPENGKRRPRPRDEGKHSKDGAGAPKNFDKAGVELEQEYHPKIYEPRVVELSKAAYVELNLALLPQERWKKEHQGTLGLALLTLDGDLWETKMLIFVPKKEA